MAGRQVRGLHEVGGLFRKYEFLLVYLLIIVCIFELNLLWVFSVIFMLEIYMFLGMHFHSYAEHVINKMVSESQKFLCGVVQLGVGDITKHINVVGELHKPW
jgi:hypothetical protein